MNIRNHNQEEENSIQNSKDVEFQNSFLTIFLKKESTDEIKYINNLYFHAPASNDIAKKSSDDIKVNNLGDQKISNEIENKNLILSKKEDENSIKKDTKESSNIKKKDNKNNILSNETEIIEQPHQKKDIDNNIIDCRNNLNNPVTCRTKIKIKGPWEKKIKLFRITQINDICFPFNSGKGLIKLDIKDIIAKVNSKNLFKTKRLFIVSDGKLKKIKKSRKFKSDDIRKKIKAKFHKTLKTIINQNLKRAGSIELFSYLSKYFMGNISKEFNKKYMSLTYEELLFIDFTKCKRNCPNSKAEQKQYIKNQNVLLYLQNNPDISKMSGFDLVKNMKYKDILQLYFVSVEFENTIFQLKNQNENDEYISAYIKLSKNYINYFTDRQNDNMTNSESSKEGVTY